MIIIFFQHWHDAYQIKALVMGVNLVYNLLSFEQVAGGYLTKTVENCSQNCQRFAGFKT